MIAMKLGWLLLELILWGVFLYFGSAAAFGMAVLLVAIPLCSLLIGLRVRKGVRVALTAPASLRKGSGGTLSIFLWNGSVFPVFRVRCRICVENQLDRQKSDLEEMTWLPGKKKKEISLDVGSDYCGRLRCSVERVVLYDIFGLIGVRCKCDAVTHLAVQPDTFGMDVALVCYAYSAEDSDVYSQERPGPDLTQTYQIREYVPGDSPRQVHWKLSGKFDKLIVRDPSLPITHDVLVFWERTGEGEDPDRIDAQAETVVSLCRSLMEQSIPFTVGWNDTDRDLCVLHEIRDMDGLVGIVPRILRAAGKSMGDTGAELLIQTRPDALCGHMVYIAPRIGEEAMGLRQFGNVRMLLCGEGGMDDAIVFDPEHYREQLARIEI